MKNLTRFTIAFLAAQLLFVGISSAAVCNASPEGKSTVNAMPPGNDDDDPTNEF